MRIYYKYYGGIIILLLLALFCLSCAGVQERTAKTPKEPEKTSKKEPPSPRVVKKETKPKPPPILDTLNQLTADSAISARPAWSPDGSKIVFHSTREPIIGDKGEEKQRNKREQEEEERDRDIWIMDRDGRNLKRLTSSSADDFDPVFSPDGKQIAYVSEDNGSRDIWLMNADGTNKTYLTSEKGVEQDPAWSPDGKQIAYSRLPYEKGGNFDIWIINVDGTGSRRLTTSSANEAGPSWHPDGKHIAYHSDEGGNLNIYIIDTEGRYPQKIIGTNMQEIRPSWSPSGTKIAYSAWPEEETSDKAEIWVANIDGSSPYQLTTTPPNMNPNWSPDSTRIVFQSKRTGSWEIWDIEVPQKVLEEGRFAFVGMVRGKGAYDLLKLKNGDLLTGTILNTSFTLRTSYAELQFPKDFLATLRFVGGAENLSQVVLLNGDKFSGFISEGRIKFKMKGGSPIEVRIEKIDTVGFGYKPGEPTHYPRNDEITLKNGDIFSGKLLNRNFNVHTDYGAVKVKTSDIKKMENIAGDKPVIKITLTNGDLITGQLQEEDLQIDLDYGPVIKVYKDNILTVQRKKPSR
jgi:Tol biopolymer transport system component